MNWESKYVVFRPNEDEKTLNQVFTCNELKKARYWLQYIAEINDVLFTTPLHPTNDDAEKPTYYLHKTKSGKIEKLEAEWAEKFCSYQMC